MGLVHSNQPFFTSPAHSLRQAAVPHRQLSKPTGEIFPAHMSAQASDPVIDWELDLPKQRPVVSEAEQWFLLVALWWGATVMAAAQLGFL